MYIKNEIVVRSSSWGYFRLREFAVDKHVTWNPKEVIDMFIKSKYFYWMDKSEMYKSNNSFQNWNFHGKYDATKIVPSDFVISSLSSYKKALYDFLHEYNTDSRKLAIIEKAIDEYSDTNNTFFILTVTDNDKLNSFTVVDWFFSSIIINIETQTFLTIEYGMD